MKNLFIPLTVLLSLSSSLFAIDIDGSSAATNDRFANDPSFVAQGIDLSGVGLVGNGRWATMISENVFVSASHFHPDVGKTLNFYSTNDFTGASMTRTVSGGERIGNTDIWVGTLDSPIAPGYTYYDIATTSNIGEEAYLTGRSVNTYAVKIDVAIGRNELDSVSSTTVANRTGDAITANYDSGPGPFGGVTYEARLETNDSGAPLFVIPPGTSIPVIQGTNWFISTDSLTGETVSSSFTDLSSERTAILAYVAANAVPEPSNFALFSLASLALITRRRRV